MATETETLKIIIALKDSASRGIRRLSQGLRSAGREARAAMSKLGGLRAVIASVGAGLLARSFIQAADTAEQYRVRLKVLLGSQQEGNRMFKEMAGFSASVSFQYEEVMGAATSLAGVMRGGTDEIKQWMPMIADLAAVTGLTLQDTTGQIIRMYSAGAASADMFRERGVLAMLGFQAKVSYSAEETRKQLMRAFEDPASQFAGASKDLAKTWSGMLSMMSDRWFQFRNMVMEAGVFDFIKTALSLWLGQLETLKKEGNLDVWAKDLAAVVMKSMESAAIAVGWVLDAFRGLEMVVDGLKILFATVGKDSTDVGAAWKKNAASQEKDLQRLGELVTNVAQKMKRSVEETQLEKLGKWLTGLGQKSADATAEMNKELKIANSWFEEILVKAVANLEATINEVPWNERIKKQLAEINELLEQQRLARLAAADADKDTKGGDGAPTKAKELPLAERLRMEMALFRESAKTNMAFLNAEWEKHALTVEEYYNERVVLAERAYRIEFERLSQLAEAEKEPKKREKILLEVFRLQEGHKRTMLAIELDRNKALKDRISGEKESAQIVADAEGRAATTGPSGLAVQFAEQLREMDDLQRTEMDALQELRVAGHATEQQEQDLHNAQMLEKEKLLADQRGQVISTYFKSVTGMLDDVSSAFFDLYKATGSDNKAFFEIYKAAAVAKTIISTIESAQAAYKAEMDLGGPGAQIRAIAAAVFASAAGAGRVAQIRAQSMAAGGKVGDYTAGGRIRGSSPHDKADNVPVNATAGEYMHPVSAVRHYGLPAMEAIRKKLVPRGVLAAFANPGISIPMGASLAGGGMVAAVPASGGDSYSVSIPINTIDTMDGLVDRLRDATENAVRTVLREELG